MLNEVVFDQYHLFHSEARIVIAETNLPLRRTQLHQFSTAPSEAPTAVVPVETGGPRASDSSVRSVHPAKSPQSTMPLQQHWESRASARSRTPCCALFSRGQRRHACAVSRKHLLRLAPHPPSPVFPCVSAPALLTSASTAYDKKGMPVTDLTREDFVISDNGKNQRYPFLHPDKRPICEPAELRRRRPPALYSNRIDDSGQRTICGHIAPRKVRRLSSLMQPA